MRYAFFLVTLLTGSLAMADDIEEPRWELLATLGSVEVREYAPGVQAVTRLNDSGDTSQGFRRLAGYIFGGNERSQSIAMTAPVQETLETGNPVMAFTMPAEYALQDLPAPDDDQVEIRPVDSKTVGAIRFSGWATRGKVERKTDELLATLQAHDLEAVGVATLNQYNPPWTPPFLRRNEVTIEVRWGDALAVRQ